MRCPNLRLAVLAAAAAAQAQASTSHDFPTLERVLFVQECMQIHPGPGYEMSSKCSCLLDTLASQLSHEEFISMVTLGKASSMAGERGGSIRDAPDLASQLQRYRALQTQGEKACFIRP